MPTPMPSMFFKSSPEIMLTPRVECITDQRFVVSFNLASHPLSIKEFTSAQAHALLQSSLFRRPVIAVVSLPSTAADPQGYLPVHFTLVPASQDQYEELVVLDAFVPEGLGLVLLPGGRAGIPIGTDFVPDMAEALTALPAPVASDAQVSDFECRSELIVDKLIQGELMGELAEVAFKAGAFGCWKTPDRSVAAGPRRLWRYHTGMRGINRVRVYERRAHGPLSVEWYDDTGRHRQSLASVVGHPVTDRVLAKSIADRMAREQSRKRHRRTATELLGLPNY